jgi:hypothetical protein
MLSSGFLSAAVTHKKTISSSSVAVGLTLLPISFSSNKWILLIGLFVLGIVMVGGLIILASILPRYLIFPRN